MIQGFPFAATASIRPRLRDWSISGPTSCGVAIPLVELGQLALLRLTEVEIHGTDLDVGAKDWSRDFVEAAFDMRLLWLPKRSPNPAVADSSVVGTWVLAPVDGDAFCVTASPSGVEVHRGRVLQPAVAYLQGSRRELLAFLLGRLPLDALDVTGNLGLAAQFHDAFPPP